MLGVFGGAFDPPHVGHVALARAAIAELGLDRLLVLVVAEPAHKTTFTPAETRLELARLAFADITEAVETPPQTTRARLRGEFVKRAKERRRDYTVDWVHLKLNDQAQRTVLCKDPFKSRDERVEKLIESL